MQEINMGNSWAKTVPVLPVALATSLLSPTVCRWPPPPPQLLESAESAQQIIRKYTSSLQLQTNQLERKVEKGVYLFSWEQLLLVRCLCFQPQWHKLTRRQWLHTYVESPPALCMHFEYFQIENVVVSWILILLLYHLVNEYTDKKQKHIVH